MSCSTQWDFEFVAKNTDIKFHNDEYRNMRAKLIMERERSLLPGTQPLVAEARCKRDMKNELEKINKDIKMYEDLLREARKRKRVLWNGKNLMPTKPEEASKNKRFIGRCPAKECKGYLDDEFNCGICGKKACPTCRQPIHKNECDKDDVETAKLLAKGTKPCPSCSVPIFKIDGCSQMFCVSCHTAFDWESGMIEKGVIHNPHYYAWQKQLNGGHAPRRVGEVRCGGPVEIALLIEKMGKVDVEESIREWVLNAHRVVYHIRHVVLPKYPGTEPNNQDLRIKYLLGDLTEKRWLSEIKRREKKREKDSAINLVLRMCCDTIDDLLHNIVATESNDVPVILIQISQLRRYVSKSLKRIQKRFENKVPMISGKWEVTEPGIRKHRR